MTEDRGVSRGEGEGSPRLGAGGLAMAIVVFAVFAWQLVRFAPYSVDDAWITFRYARNLAQGLGPVWNAGERVEGFTTPFWVLTSALAEKGGIDPLLFARALSGLTSILLLVRLQSAARRWFGWGTAASWLPSLFLALTPSFGLWTMSGMEPAFFTWAIFEAIRSHVDDDHGGARGGWLALASWVRPEGWWVSGVLLVWAAIRRLRGWKTEWAIACSAIGSLFAIRIAFYGDLLPNTFYAKSAFVHHSVVSAWAFFTDHPGYLVALAAPFVAAARSRLLVPMLLLAGFLAYPDAVGGDEMPCHRFFLVALPWLALFTCAVVFRFRRLGAIVGAAALATIAWQAFDVHDAMAIFYTDRVARLGRETGEWLRDHTSPGDVIAANAVGTMGYYSGRPMIDMLGLCDRHIARRKDVPFRSKAQEGVAHARGDGRYVLSRRPAIIVMANSSGSDDPFYLSDIEIFEAKEFAELYVRKSAIIGREVREFAGLRMGGRETDFYRYFEWQQSELEPSIRFRQFFRYGFDISAERRWFPRPARILSYPFTFTFWVRKDHPLAARPDESAIDPAPPIPESAMNDGQLLAAAVFDAARGKLDSAERIVGGLEKRHPDDEEIRAVASKIRSLRGAVGSGGPAGS